LNALVHRNYMGAPTQIRVYDDKITFWNEGKLPNDLTLELLKRTHSSRPRNLIIADVCFKGGLIDAWGRGTIKIIDSCKEAGLPEPALIEENGGFLVTLFKDNLTTERLTQLGLNDRQLKAVNFVKEKEKITNKEYQGVNETSDRTAFRDLENLTELGIFVKTGEKKGTSYKLKSGG
jgi:ATP-dependent DNA helicase RecG